MKSKCYPFKIAIYSCFLWGVFCLPVTLRAQFAVCSDPSMLFGMSNSGFIFPISSSNANVGAQLNTANYTITTSYNPTATSLQANTAAAGNGIGYNNTNGMFYYFKRSPSQSSPQFVSYDPVTNKYTILANPSSTINTNTGCVNFNGLGYYTINTQGQLFYYDIVANTWTLITSSIVDQTGTDISAYIQTHGSGDIACDGQGNLWIMPSSSSEYGLFKLSAPLPTTPQASVTVTTMLAGTTPTPTGFSLWGIAFDPLGSIYMSTGDDKLYKLINTASPPVYVGAFNGPITGIGADLTSCAYPMWVLPLRFTAFSATLQNNTSVVLNWTVSTSGGNTKGFFIEHSADGLHWGSIGYTAINPLNSTQSYYFTDPNPAAAINYYRIRAIDYDDAPTYSAVKVVSLKSSGRVSFWPNPTPDVLNIQADGNGTATVFDLSGRVLLKNLVQAGVNRLNLEGLPTGTYLVQVSLQNGQLVNQKIIKQ